MLETFQIFTELPELIQEGRRVKIIWREDRRLTNSAVQIITKQPAITLYGFFLLCLNNLPSKDNKKPNRDCLIAFLSRVAIDVVNTLKKSLSQFQSSELKQEFEIDLYQIALEVVSKEVRFFFINFDPQYNSDCIGIQKVYSYSYGKIKGKVIDRVRVGRPTAWRSNLGLLSRVSSKIIREALINSGARKSLPIYLLAVECFLEAKNAKEINTEAQNNEDFEPVVKLFYQRKKDLLVIPDDFPNIDSEWMNQGLRKIGQAIRSYLEINNKMVSSDTPIGDESDSSTIEDRISDLSNEGYFSSSIIDNIESEEQQQQLKNYFYEQLVAFNLDRKKTDSKTILFAYYILNLTHQKIAKDLGVKAHTTISRRRQSELKKLINLMFEDLASVLKLDKTKITAVNSDELKTIKNVVETLIKEHYYTLLKQKIELVLLDEYLNSYEQKTARKRSDIEKLHQQLKDCVNNVDYSTVENNLLEHLGETSYFYWQQNLKQLIILVVNDRSITLNEIESEEKSLIESIEKVIKSLLLIDRKLPNIEAALRSAVEEWLKKYNF